ncbi:MAG TPA: DNA recombination protein RmuC, partial [Phycisphaerae bacterium]|nr:DNA recombination protein RmuC [Phycisphaerae bacterium]
MTELLLGLAILLSLACLVLLLVVLGRLRQSDSAGLLVRLDAFEKGQDKLERAVREEIAKNRSESLAAAKQQREEAGAAMQNFANSIFTGVADLTRLQKTQLEAFAAQLAKLTESNEKKMEAVRATVEAKLKEIQTDNAARLEQM